MILAKQWVAHERIPCIFQYISIYIHSKKFVLWLIVFRGNSCPSQNRDILFSKISGYEYNAIHSFWQKHIFILKYILYILCIDRIIGFCKLIRELSQLAPSAQGRLNGDKWRIFLSFLPWILKRKCQSLKPNAYYRYTNKCTCIMCVYIHCKNKQSSANAFYVNF